MSQSVCPPCFWDSGTQCGYVLRNTGQEREEQDAATQRQAGTRDVGLGYRWTVEAEAGLVFSGFPERFCWTQGEMPPHPKLKSLLLRGDRIRNTKLGWKREAWGLRASQCRVTWVSHSMSLGLNAFTWDTAQVHVKGFIKSQWIDTMQRAPTTRLMAQGGCSHAIL